MPKFIKRIVDRVNLANRKGLCNFYSAFDITAEVHAESMNLWKKYVEEFERTQKISVFLDPLKSTETITLTAGVGTLVNAKGQYKTGAFTSADKKVALINIDKWAAAVNDTVRVPDDNNPIALIEGESIKVLPSSVPSVTIHYLKKPTEPVYATTQDGEDYVYDDGNSVDFEWGEEVHDEIMNRVLANLGISQREPALVQYSSIEQQKEGR